VTTGTAAVAALLVSEVHARQPSRPSPAAAGARLDAGLRAAVDRKEVPGVVAMAADRRRIIYQGAFGSADAANNRPMTADAIFRIASMTKAVTSVAAMQLVEQGRIGLDDAMSKYFPAFKHLSVFEAFDSGTGAYTLRPARKAITVRQLMTHTSGLGYGFTSAVLRDFKPRENERYEVGPLLFEPGEKWWYGTSTDWVGRLVESVSGETLDAYFRDHIFRPIGMIDTFFNLPEDRQARLVTVHQRSPDGTLVEQPRQAPRPVTQFNGGAGLSCTARDYIAFLQMLLNDGQTNGRAILRADTVRLMATNQIGAVGVAALETAQPELSDDFTFIADGRDKWGLGFLITTDRVAGKRSPGSLSWGGIDNTYFWIDRARGVAGVIMMQFLPFADPRALAAYDAFERGVYQLQPGS
jgi:CubicO group peptidase (beta-lactamase class C family)